MPFLARGALRLFQALMAAFVVVFLFGIAAAFAG